MLLGEMSSSKKSKTDTKRASGKTSHRGGKSQDKNNLSDLTHPLKKTPAIAL
jgi:hypothetical protein